MMNQYHLHKTKSDMIIYNEYLAYIDKILQRYPKEDKIYLISENNGLKEQLKKTEAILKKLTSCAEEARADFQKYFMHYFNELKQGIRDFLILLKWNNSGAFRKELHALCKEKSILPLVEKENYKTLLYILNEKIN